jgi:curved DNA-binding protein CbpA
MSAQERNLTITQALDILSLPLSASQDDIHAAYRKAARRTHPDRNPGNPQLARQQFDQVQEAYRVLTDPAVVTELKLATADRPQPPYGFDQLEAFRTLGLGPRATYDEIDARLMLLSSETDASKRINVQAAYNLLTKPRRDAQSTFANADPRALDSESVNRQQPQPGNAPLATSAILFMTIGFVLVAALVLLITTGGHSAVSEVATGLGVLACFFGAVRGIS